MCSGFNEYGTAGRRVYPFTIIEYLDDGRFATLLDVVNHCNTHFSLGLTDVEKADLVEYLKSLGDAPMR